MLKEPEVLDNAQTLDGLTLSKALSTHGHTHLLGVRSWKGICTTSDMFGGKKKMKAKKLPDFLHHRGTSDSHT